MTYVAESGHWYTKNGEPAYTVTGANGKERPTTLRDARRIGLVPSVTGIIKCAASPGLQHYREEQMLLAALTLPRRPHESEKAWIDRVWQDSREHARKAADKGTALHAALQRHYESVSYDRVWDVYIKGAASAIADKFPSSQWVAEKTFAHHEGYGGKTDLHHTMNGGVVLDCKTKEFDDPDKLRTYDEHAMQLAAYREGLSMPQAACGILYVSVSAPGVVRLMMLSDDELRRGWNMFVALLQYWKAKNMIDAPARTKDGEDRRVDQ